MNFAFWIQLILFEIFDVVPFVILAATPFRNKIRSRKAIVAFTVVLYVLGLIRRSICYITPSYTVIFSILWSVLYLAVYYFVLRQPLYKLLFILVTILNYASLTTIIYNYIGSHLFLNTLKSNPYCLEISLSIIIILAITFPFLFYWMKYKVSPLIETSENNSIWKTLWLVPVTFCIFFYYNLYSSESILEFSSNIHNFIFSLIINAGLFFILSLILQLVEISMLNSRLLSEKHQLELQNFQFERLSERIEEAKQARHNMRQWITILQVYLKNEDTTQLRSYISQFCSSFSIDTSIVYCLYPPLNALINYYANLAAKQNIVFHAQVEYHNYTKIQDADLIVLFGNLLENAIEACNRQKTKERFIQLNVKRIKGYIIIALDNSFSGNIKKDGDSFYSSKRKGYGIGITSIRQITEKYHGTSNFKIEKNVFFASLALEIGEEKIFD